MPTNYAMSPTPTAATSLPIDAPRVRHVTTATPPLIEGCGWMTSATSRLSTAAMQRPLRATSLGRTPALEHHITKPEEEGGSMGARRKANEEGKGGLRRKGKLRGDREEGGGQHLLPPFRVVSNGGSVCCPISLHFEQGQHTLPPFLFISNGGSTCCPRFSLFQMGRHVLPRFFSFRTGAAYATPFSLR